MSPELFLCGTVAGAEAATVGKCLNECRLPDFSPAVGGIEMTRKRLLFRKGYELETADKTIFTAITPFLCHFSPANGGREILHRPLIGLCPIPVVKTPATFAAMRKRLNACLNSFLKLPNLGSAKSREIRFSIPEIRSLFLTTCYDDKRNRLPGRSRFGSAF